MAIVISNKIEAKLKDKHAVSRLEVEQCFENILGKFLIDTREKNKTDPATMWFISPTNKNRLLKIVFVFKDNNFFIKTAYDPNAEEINIYLAKG